MVGPMEACSVGPREACSVEDGRVDPRERSAEAVQGTQVSMLEIQDSAETEISKMTASKVARSQEAVPEVVMKSLPGYPAPPRQVEEVEVPPAREEVHYQAPSNHLHSLPRISDWRWTYWPERHSQ